MYELAAGPEINTVPPTVEIYLGMMEIHCHDIIGTG